MQYPHLAALLLDSGNSNFLSGSQAGYSVLFVLLSATGETAGSGVAAPLLSKPQNYICAFLPAMLFD